MLGVTQGYYYLYTGMTWYNSNLDRPIEDEGFGFGLFVQNEDDYSVDGWWCEVDNSPFS
jgi:hypothetical protein